MPERSGTLPGLALASFAVFGALPALAGDLSKYRGFQLGADLPAVARQVGTSPSQARIIHSRPALVQNLEWRPQPLGHSPQTESAKEVVFSFYNGELYRIVVNYDRYAMEGLTVQDVVDAVSIMYGTAATPPIPVKAALDQYGDQEEVLARWQDPQYRFDLIRLSYGPSYRLTGILKRLEAPVQAALLEAARLDDQEAPERDARRIATEQQIEQARLEKARLTNRPRFRP